LPWIQRLDPVKPSHCSCCYVDGFRKRETVDRPTSEVVLKWSAGFPACLLNTLRINAHARQEILGHNANTALVTSMSACPLRCRAPPSDSTRLPGPFGSPSRWLLRWRTSAPTARSSRGPLWLADPVGSCGLRPQAGAGWKARVDINSRPRIRVSGQPGPGPGCRRLITFR
jgi:hypothetical protein